MADALSGTNYVHDEIGTNQCFDWGWIEDNRAATDAAIKSAHHVTTLELVNNRLVPNAMEPRCSMAAVQQGNGDYTLHTTSQNPHLTRLLISAFVLGIPENKLTVIAPDVGGGFGSKIYHYGEEALVLAAAKKLGRPVKWTSDRYRSVLDGRTRARSRDQDRIGTGRRGEFPRLPHRNHGQRRRISVELLNGDTNLLCTAH